MSSVPTPSLFARLGGRPRLQHLLRHFYADVRQHAVIGPIFAAQIHDWPSHLEKIADFWSGATGGPALYSGPMPWKHVRSASKRTISMHGSISGVAIAARTSEPPKPPS